MWQWTEQGHDLNRFWWSVILIFAVSACSTGGVDSGKSSRQQTTERASQTKMTKKRRAPRPPSAAEPIIKQTSTKPKQPDLAPDELSLQGHVGFIGQTKIGQHPWKFQTWTGRVRVPKDVGLKAKFTIQIQMDTAVPDGIKPTAETNRMQAQLQSITFHVAAHLLTLCLDVGHGGEYRWARHVFVTGQLTLLGTRKEVIFPATVAFENGKFSGKGSFSLHKNVSIWSVAARASMLLKTRLSSTSK